MGFQMIGQKWLMLITGIFVPGALLLSTFSPLPPLIGGSISESATPAPVAVTAAAVQATGTPISKADALQLTLAAGLGPALTVTSVLNPDVALDAGVSASEYEDTPDFFLTLFDGQNFRLSEQRGKIVVVNFWASWCGPCRHEMPDLMTVWEKYKDYDVVFIGIDTDDDPESGLIFAHRLNVAYPLGFDKDGVIANAYFVRAYPATILIDRAGKTKILIPGMTNTDELAHYLDEILGIEII